MNLSRFLSLGKLNVTTKLLFPILALRSAVRASLLPRLLGHDGGRSVANRFWRKTHVWWLFAVVIVFVTSEINSVRSGSVDLAHHYALVFRLHEHWALPAVADPSLGEMNIYPRVSHFMAALTGVLLKSSFFGLNAVALLSLALLWMFIVLLYEELPRPKAILSLLILASLLLLNMTTFQLEFHGAEINNNYFFSQLVAQAVLFAGLLLATRVEKRFGGLWSAVALTLVMLVDAAIHLLPAVEILGVIFGSLAVNFVRARRARKSLIRQFALSSTLAILGLVGIILHPAFSAMRAISANNGGLDLHVISYPVGLTAICFLVLVTSAHGIIAWCNAYKTNELYVRKYISLYGFSVSALCLAQLAISRFGYGSDYAVKKYAFGLFTVLLLQITLISTDILANALRTRAVLARDETLKVSVASVAALIIALCCTLTTSKVLDASDLVATEEVVTRLSGAAHLPTDPSRPSVVVGLDKVPNVVDYMFSIGILHTPRELAIPDVLEANALTDPNRYAYIISSDHNPRYGSFGCATVATGGQLAVVASTCIQKRLARASYCEGKFDFSDRGIVPDQLMHGFGSPEDFGRWSVGHASRIECILPAHQPKIVRFSVRPFLYGSMHKQRIEIYINGAMTFQDDFDATRTFPAPIEITLPPTVSAQKYDMEFKFPDATSPSQLGMSNDTRQLGFAFYEMTFE